MTDETRAPVDTSAAGAETTTSNDSPPAETRRRRWPWITALVVAFALFMAAGAFAGATVSYADSLAGRLLPGTTIAGMDVGAKTHAEALKVVRGALAEELNRTITVRWRGQRWEAEARDLGARNNARHIIRKVARSQTGLTWQDWARLRWLDERSDSAADVKVRYDRATTRRWVGAIAADVDEKPVDATMGVEGDDVVIGESAVGYRTRRQLAVDAVMQRLRGKNKPVELAVRTLKPEVKGSEFSQVLLLDQSEHRLTLHLDGEATNSWIVATGTGDFPTPVGTYSITLKRYMPTWINPDPEGWGKDMPESIPPGESNPLGLRALNWSAPGAIRFHGTQAVDTLGTDASHGCVRMSNPDVIELYDLIDVGAVIISRT